MVKIYSFPVGPLQANCHILFCAESNDAIIVDPGAEGKRIISKINKIQANPVMILITHGHGDHIGAVKELKEEFDIPIAIHEKETHMLTDSRANLSMFLGEDIIAPPADQTFVEGGMLEFCGIPIQILETEGHSPMGCSFLIENHLISGDTLFKESIGRTDFPGGSHETLVKRIKEKLFVLPDDTIVYPGHGPNTTIGEEKKNNPFLQ